MDIDALDPAHAPGVSHREPGGLSTRQVIDLIHTIDQPIVAADIFDEWQLTGWRTLDSARSNAHDAP
jgi:Arginase family